LSGQQQESKRCFEDGKLTEVERSFSDFITVGQMNN
jgi:hypothetical protein